MAAETGSKLTAKLFASYILSYGMQNAKLQSRYLCFRSRPGQRKQTRCRTTNNYTGNKMADVVNRKFSYLMFWHQYRQNSKENMYVFQSPRSTEAYPILVDHHPHRKQYGGRCKPEVLISQFVVHIETKFRSLCLCFWGRPGQQKHTRSLSTKVDTGSTDISVSGI